MISLSNAFALFLCFFTVSRIVEAAFGIAINNTAVRWFKSKELNLVMALKTSTARMVREFLICDVISETFPYCGTNIVGPDQTPCIMRDV